MSLQDLSIPTWTLLAIALQRIRKHACRTLIAELRERLLPTAQMDATLSTSSLDPISLVPRLKEHMLLAGQNSASPLLLAANER
jgi:hypothetical protein